MPLRSSKKDKFCYDHYIPEAILPTQNWQKKKKTKKTHNFPTTSCKIPVYSFYIYLNFYWLDICEQTCGNCS